MIIPQVDVFHPACLRNVAVTSLLRKIGHVAELQQVGQGKGQAVKW